MKKTFLIILSCTVFYTAFAQLPVKPPIMFDGGSPSSSPMSSSNPYGNMSMQANQSSRKDSLGFEHRDDSKDALVLTYRFMDSTRKNTLDSTVNDFDKYFPIPSSYQYLGNNGAAAVSLIFKPNDFCGFDPELHAFDLYKFKIEETKFYKTNHPFSMLSYQLATGKEQMLKAGHAQSPKPNLNFGFDYRLINAPGLFVTQNNNHNSYRLFGNYQGKRKRYNLWLTMVGNNIRASENGGIQNVDDLSDPNRKDRFAVPVNLGGAAAYSTNPFITKVYTGNNYKDFNFFVRQSYDLGKKDSIAINDTTTEYLFYPKLRFQHSLTISNLTYRFSDIYADSAQYNSWYNINLSSSKDSFSVLERWNILNNDFSILQFPDTKNTAQFFLAGINFQNITGELKTGRATFYNLMAHAEYRNRTKNKLWDMIASGEFYVNGLNAGDYSASASISRYISKKFGNVSLYFNNINRTPSFIFDERSSFNLTGTGGFKKENITSFGAQSNNSIAQLRFDNHLILNYCYYKNRYEPEQYSTLINIVQVSASKKINLTRKWKWYADATVQQTDKASPVRIPLLFTRNRLAFEGVFFKNLNLSTGIEMRYYSPYKAYGYSPVNGQFTLQDTTVISNLPDIAAFLHFRIKGFTGFLRAENLNTMSINNGFGFVNNNFAAPSYPTQGLMIRFGIQWWFVN